MGRLQIGPATDHILVSHGPSYYPMDFYTTQYSQSYGNESFIPKTGMHIGSGYISNTRPTYSYTQSMDEYDNPEMAKLCSENYESITSKDYKLYPGPNPKEPFAENYHHTNSGFTREQHRHELAPDMVNFGVYYDSRKKLPQIKSKPLLHMMAIDCPLDKENNYNGPAYMSTENKAQFDTGNVNLGDLSKRKVVGHKEESGFTLSVNDDPILFKPNSDFKGDKPGKMTDRPTGESITKTDFQNLSVPLMPYKFPPIIPQVVRNRPLNFCTAKSSTAAYEPISTDCQNSDICETWMKKNDPVEYLNLKNPDPYKSVNTLVHSDPLKVKNEEFLANPRIGNMEGSGFVLNSSRFNPVEVTPEYITTYKEDFIDNTLKGKDREGHTWGCVRHFKNPGFTEPQPIHKFLPILDRVGQNHPYVERSLRRRDQTYGEIRR